ncbi:MAG TPA: N-acetyl-gamma-glutamyl-phosphate reductase [Kofleriaceae bacterium]|nr:N-acetyl-gamma-glutamyl-phosphate reductase [Kofleriaceae bacterium]
MVGASGYTGAELLRLLVGHPRVEVVAVCATEKSAGQRIDRLFPSLAGSLALTIEVFDAARVAERAEVVFTALPHGHSARAVAELRARGRRVVDLSADYRLHDAETYRTWYGDHPHTELLAGAVYGLPELHRAELAGAELIAAPGCYPTAATLAIAPLLARGLVRPDSIVVDAKSGVSGAGRSAALGYHFPEVGESLRPYKVAGTHRHTPEMEQEMSRAAGAPVRVLFTPHLVPMTRGILACVYADPARAVTEAELRAAQAEAYAGEPFVAALEGDALPDTAHVRGSNRAQVAVRHDARTGKVLAISAIDNLVKGASGQAIQCMNAALGWPETDGLLGAAVFP